MTLGIAVVYLVRERNEALLDLHLDRIARHTSSPFTIYGAAPRLAGAPRSRLAARPEVRLVDLPMTPARGPEEHSFYLDRLLAHAVADGVTHVAAMHVDSFPVRDGWDTDLGSRLTPSRPFAAAIRSEVGDLKPFTALMFAGANWVSVPGLRLLLAPAELATVEYRRYRAAEPHHPDSGVGWGFAAWREGWDWVRLPRSNRGADHLHFGGIYGDTVFHLGAAAWSRKDFPDSPDPTPGLRVRRVGTSVGRNLPAAVRGLGKRVLARVAPSTDIERKYDAHEAAFTAVRDRLLDDPDAYLSFLRHGTTTSPRC